MQKTTNYNLNQWEAVDPVRREDFNADNAAIDAALGMLFANVGSGGSNCRVEWGSYTGTGTFGDAKPTALTFAFKPLLLVICSSNFEADAHGPTLLIRGQTVGIPVCGTSGSTEGVMQLLWENDGIFWFAMKSSAHQNNQANAVYHYVVLGVDE